MACRYRLAVTHAKDGVSLRSLPLAYSVGEVRDPIAHANRLVEHLEIYTFIFLVFALSVSPSVAADPPYR